MAEVRTDFTGSDAQLQKVMHSLQQQNVKLIEQNRQLAAASQQGHDQAVSGAQRVIGSLVTMAASYFTVQAAVQAVTSALKDQEEQRRRAARKTIDQAGPQRALFQNIGSVTEGEQRDFDAKLMAIGKSTTPRGGVATVYRAATSALSAGGGGSDTEARARALDATKAALAFAPTDPAVAEEIASAVIDLGKATKSNKAIENLGYLKNLGDVAHVRDWASIAKNLTKGITGATDNGFTPQEAGATLSAITQGSNDTSGRTSATAMVQFAVKLAEFLPTEDRYTEKYNPILRRKARTIDRKGTGMKTWEERRQYMFEHPQEREQFLAEYGGDVKQKTAIKQLLTPGKNVTDSFYLEGMKAFGVPLDTMGKNAEKAIAQWDRNFKQLTDKAQRSSEWTKETATTEPAAGKENAVNAEFTSGELDKQLEALNQSYALRFRAWYSYWVKRTHLSEEEAYKGVLSGVAKMYKPGTEIPLELPKRDPGEDDGSYQARVKNITDWTTRRNAAVAGNPETYGLIRSGFFEKKRLADLQREAADKERMIQEGAPEGFAETYTESETIPGYFEYRNPKLFQQRQRQRFGIESGDQSESQPATAPGGVPQDPAAINELISVTKEVRDEIRGMRGNLNNPTPAAVQANARRR
jgi:hypothetical protein